MIDYMKLKEMSRRDKEDIIRTRKEKSLRILQKIVKRRCTTIFIGSLDSIEQRLGQLWGLGKLPQELTDREKLFLQIWKDLRKEILDKGNNQTQTLISEIELIFKTNLE